MELTQSLPCHVGVNLGSRNIAVSKQHLHDPQVRAVIEQVGGKRMAQSVR